MSVEFGILGFEDNEDILFQYFKCVGWIIFIQFPFRDILMFQYFKCVGWIRIMDIYEDEYEEFQYFKCVGWIDRIANSSPSNLSFNTSNVSVEWQYCRQCKDDFSLFQYFKCVGWMLMSLITGAEDY